MRKKLLLFLTLVVLGWGSVCAQTQKYSGHAPSDVIGGSTDNDKILYLYNVGTEKFLDKGGIWGTQTVLNAGIPLSLVAVSNSSAYRLQYGSSYIAMIDGTKGANTSDYLDVFVDRTNEAVTGKFTFTAVSETTAGVKNAYTISLTSESDTYKGTYYLVNEDGVVAASKTEPTDANGWWILVTKQDLLNDFSNTEASNATPATATFNISDYDFSRNSPTVSSWKYGSGTSMSNPSGDFLARTPDCRSYYYYQKGNTTSINTDFLSIDDQNTVSGYTKSTKSVTSTTYYIGNGYTGDNTKVLFDEILGTQYDAVIHAQRLYGGDWTGNVHGASGKLYQQVTVTLRAGWYKIGCEGFSTDGSGKLFAQVGSETTIGDTYKTVAFKTLATSDVPTTYVKAARLINGGGYEQSVEVYVEKNQTVTFGVLVEGGSSSSWTCVDNFSIKYCGGEKQQTVAQLILSEDETSVDYINKQVNAEKSFTLRLHRSLSANLWNSLVLPVSLTGAQVQSAFGGNTKLSKLAKTANNGKQIIFEPVTVSNDDNVAITAGELYIIKPQNSETSFAEAQTRNDIEGFNVSINSGYTITQVTLPANVEASVSGPIVDGGDEDGNLQHVGTYVKVAENAIPKDTYILSKGKWYYNTVAVTSVKGFRGWIATNVEKATESKMTFVIDGVEEEVGGQTTAIDAIGADQSANGRSAKGIYSLSGQKISDGTATDGLGKGVYIVGGKKVVIK